MLTLCNSDGDGEVQEGSNAVIGLPINTSTGDGSLESTGVARRSSIARCRLCFSLLHFLMIFLMVCTCLSMNPLDCVNLGDEVVCWMPHLWTKSWNGVLSSVITDNLVGSSKQ